MEMTQQWTHRCLALGTQPSGLWNTLPGLSLFSARGAGKAQSRAGQLAGSPGLSSHSVCQWPGRVLKSWSGEGRLLRSSWVLP